VLPARHHDLDERDPLVELGKFLERDPERVQLVGDPLRIVEPVHAQDEPPVPGVLLDEQRAVAHRRRFGDRLEVLEVDPDREGAEPHAAIAHVQRDDLALPLHARVADQRAHALHEVLAVARRLESDQVELQERAQELGPPRELHVDVERREGDVQEERGPRLQAQRAQLLGHDEQVVVVNPDEVVVAGRLGGHLRVLAVDRLVDRPVGGIEVSARLEVVEQRPQDLVREAVVELVALLGRENDGLQRVA
jgi:hypothetical protein